MAINLNLKKRLNLNDHQSNELIRIFIYNITDEIKNTKTINDFLEELRNLYDYDVFYESNILYGKDDETFENIMIFYYYVTGMSRLFENLRISE